MARGNAARRMSVGDGIVEHLLAEGVDTVFGIPGAHMYDLTDAMARAGDRLRFIGARHEQGAAWMAYGYAQATGKTGVFTVVPGPGMLNAGAALSTAYAANAPVLCLTGNVMSHLIGQGRGQLHELPDQIATMRGFTRYAERIDHPTDVERVMRGAFRAMRNGRGGPAAVEAPWDVFGMQGMVDAPRIAEFEPPAVDPVAIEKAAALVAQAEKPMIMVGGGALHASEAVRALARKIGAPVLMHRSGKGILADDDPMGLGLIEGFDYWRDVDLLIGIGSRLEAIHLRWRWLPEGLKTVRIDLDPTEFVRLPCEGPVLADAAEGAAALAAACEARPGPEGLEALHARATAAYEKIQPQQGHLAAIRRAMPANGILVEEICQHGFTARIGWRAPAPRTYISCAYQETLGFGYGTALGVKAGRPDAPVVSVCGDGGFMFAVQELATAAQENLGVIVVVFDNSAYGNVRRDQQMSYEGRFIGSELKNPDFVAMARAFGVHAEEAATNEALEAAVARCIAMGGPALIRVPVETGSETSPWPHIFPAPPV